MPDPTDVITSQHIASFQAVINAVDKHLEKIKPKAAKITYFKKRLKEFATTRKNLIARIKKIEGGIGSLPRQDGSVNSLITDLKTYKKEVETVSGQSHQMVYMFGNSKVKTAQALEAKVKAALPQSCKSNASQAVNDAVGGKGKDASKAGTGVLHASAGKTGVSSCTVFFRRLEVHDGLETHVIVDAVGSHDASSSYQIHWSNSSKLKAGKVFAF